MQKIRNLRQICNISAEMAGGFEGAIRRIDTFAWWLARLLPPSAADTRENTAAEIWGVTAMNAIQKLNAKMLRSKVTKKNSR